MNRVLRYNCCLLADGAFNRDQYYQVFSSGDVSWPQRRNRIPVNLKQFSQVIKTWTIHFSNHNCRNPATTKPPYYCILHNCIFIGRQVWPAIFARSAWAMLRKACLIWCMNATCNLPAWISTALEKSMCYTFDIFVNMDFSHSAETGLLEQPVLFLFFRFLPYWMDIIANRMLQICRGFII